MRRSPAAPAALLRFDGARRRDPAVAQWFADRPGELGAMARRWFNAMRRRGADVRELVHDGCAVACVGDAPFAYVNAFRAHVNVGFFQGAFLPDPAGLLEGTGRFMRHVKLRPGRAPDAKALEALVGAAYEDIVAKLGGGASPPEKGGRMPAKKAKANEDADASGRIDARIAGLGDWRGPMLAKLRAAIRAADAGIVEEWKWDVPVWSCDGIVCTGETYKSAVKLTFARGASVADPAGLFNASLEGHTRRAIDFREGDAVDAKALQALIRAAVAANRSRKKG